MRSPHELVDPDGRRLIMVFTDCVAPLWAKSAMWRTLKQWARFSPVVLVNVLPPRLWPHTALGAADVRMRSTRPGLPNAQLGIDLPWWSSGAELTHMIPLPVVTLEGGSISDWARMVMGGGGIEASGLMGPFRPFFTGGQTVPKLFIFGL